MSTKSAIVIGVGEEKGLGAALCRKFASQGYQVYVAGRTADKVDRVASTITGLDGKAVSVVVDATRERDVSALFDQAFSATTHDAPDLIVFNAGNNQRLDFRELSVEKFEEFWRVGCLAGFITGREAARRLVPLGRGTVLFTGASASLRGRPGFAHFAAPKAGLRMISQSMAREFGPQGIHVAHVVIDGGINGHRLQQGNPARFAELGDDGLLGIDAVAESYWHLHQQKPSAWTQEIDLRPFKESF
jgi:NAD(P)-dependent dehydrogenase (short-subunit alcohol dehydrogenase family)